MAARIFENCCTLHVEPHRCCWQRRGRYKLPWEISKPERRNLHCGSGKNQLWGRALLTIDRSSGQHPTLPTPMMRKGEQHDKKSFLFQIKLGREGVTNWTGRTLCTNCLLKHVIERKIEGMIRVTGRRGRRRKQLLDDFKEMTKCWKLK